MLLKLIRWSGAEMQNRSSPESLKTMLWRLKDCKYGVFSMPMSLPPLLIIIWLELFRIFNLNFLRCYKWLKSRISGTLFKVTQSDFKFENLPMIPLSLFELSKKLRDSFSIRSTLSVSSDSASRKLTYECTFIRVNLVEFWKKVLMILLPAARLFIWKSNCTNPRRSSWNF